MRRRVLLVTRPGVGGAARHVELLCGALDARRFELTVLASPLEDPGFLDHVVLPTMSAPATLLGER